MSETIWYVSVAAIGVILGVATLPWANRVDKACRPWLWVLTWACFWLFLLIFAAWEGIKAYRKAWWGYSDRKQAAKHRQ